MAGGFESLGLMAEILRSVDEMGWNLPTDVQDEAIPLILGGGDVMVASETGTGKTGAFCLPIIQVVHERLRDDSKEKASTATIKGPPDIRLSDSDRDALMTISPDGLNGVSTADKIWAGARATHGVKSGNYYFEATVHGTGICRLGWSSMAAHLELGKDAHGFGFGGTGKKSTSNGFDDYGDKYTNNDTIGCYVNWTDRSISYSKNGTFLGAAFKIPDSLIGSVVFPAIVVKGAGATFNFGTTPFLSFVNPGTDEYLPLIQAKAEDLIGATAKEAFSVKGKRFPLAVIIEPAKDLAEQVYQALLSMSKYVSGPELKIELFVGGDDGKRHKKILAQGVDIIVGTTGKLGGCLDDKSLDLSHVKFFVLDEADRLVDGENLQKVLQLYAACPSGGTGDNRLQACFFSATLHSPEITDLATKICVNPTWVDLKGIDSVPDTVHHVVYRVHPERDAGLLTAPTVRGKAVTDNVHAGGKSDTDEDKNSQLLKELKYQVLLGILDKFDMSQCMIFCRTNVDCDNLETFLNNVGGGKQFMGKVEKGKENAYSCCVLAGMRSMSDRRRNLEAFKDGDVRFLICTDVAARGIDVKGLPFVVNFTLPDTAENYIHRIGRVGRAEHYGLAISIVAAEDVKEKVWFHTCNSKGKGGTCNNRKLVDQGGCCIWYDEADLLEKVEERLHNKIEVMDSSYELPSAIAALGASYGEEIRQTGGVANLHLESLGPILKELRGMEEQAQNTFLRMQTSFGGGSGARGASVGVL